MPEESPPAHVPEGRVSTGNAGLDAMLEGGLVPHRPYLVVGPAGTGKSRLALQFLCEGARRGERVLLVTLEEPPNEARVNHRGLAPELDSVDVFDAIPDVMRYERTPFKDIASVRAATPFRKVSFDIRRTPELTSVEVTITALEQMLRSEVLHRNYTRVVIDSLTALQYFCMKGFDPVAGAQTFLRFLSDLQVTTILTVESPLEDADTPERMLARGEIRLFRWELDDQTVRAIGVEKFRGSPHDVRLHPYRIGPRGLDINLRVTISRDTRMIIEPIAPALPVAEPPTITMEPMAEAVRDLVLVGADLGGFRAEVEAALAATSSGNLEQAELHIASARALTVDLAQTVRQRSTDAVPLAPGAAEAFQRILARADAIRVGVPPGQLPPPPALATQLAQILGSIPPPVAPAPAVEAPPPPAAPIEPPSPPARGAVEPPAESAPGPSVPTAHEPSGPPPPATPAEVIPEVAPEPASPAAAPPVPPPPAPETPSTPAPPSTLSPPKPRETAPSVAEFLAPRGHLLPEPPPLPAARPSSSKGLGTERPSNAPARPPAPRTAGSAVPESHRAPPPGGHVAVGRPAPGEAHPALPKAPSAPGTVVAAPAHPSEVEAPTTKRRRKGATPPKKKLPVSRSAHEHSAPVEPSATAPEPVPPPLLPEVPPTPAALAPAPETPAPESPAVAEANAPPAKPKRRGPRKKKAPPVVAATPGAAPSDGPVPVEPEPASPPPAAGPEPKEGG